MQKQAVYVFLIHQPLIKATKGIVHKELKAINFSCMFLVMCVDTGIEISNPQKVAYILILSRISKEKLRETLHLSSFSLTQLLQSCPTLCNLWTVAYQAPLSVVFSRQEYWSGLPCPPPGDLLHPGI